MLTVPTTFWPYLLSQAWRFVEVYEIEAFAGRSILRYSSQDLTWGGNAYTGLAVQRSPIKQQMEFRVPDCRVTFSNVTNVLRAHLTPTDTLTGARMTIRLLIRDGSNTLLTDSLVLFRGVIEPPNEITEDSFELTVKGIVDGRGVDCPSRRFYISCPWQFANLGAFDGNGDCSYQSNTTASGSGSSSTALTLAAASTFRNGDSIQIGGGTAVTIASGGGTVNITLSAARTWSNGATVRYADCPNRSRTECEARGMLHRFGGFPGVASTARIGRKSRYFTRDGSHVPEGNPARGFGGSGRSTPTFVEIGQPQTLIGSVYADPSKPVPVLFGRRRVSPVIVEASTTQSPYNVKAQRTSFHVVSEGEIDSVVRYYVDDKLGVDGTAYIGWTAGDKTWGIFYRVGTAGLNDQETVAEYITDPTTQLRTQNIDYRSFAAIAYSRSAYQILVQALGIAKDEGTFLVDAKGIKIQKYDAAGATSGSPVWTASPMWQVFWWLTKPFGIGLTNSDVDFAVLKPEADYAETLITSTEASTAVTVAQASASTRCIVGSTEGFICGRRVDVNGSSNTVSDVVSDIELTLGTAVTQSIGHTVVQRPERFESHIYIATADRGTRWLDKLLTACRGYLTYDNGKVQPRIERDTCKERLTDGGFETWASSSDLTAGTETVSAGNTISREGTIIQAGTYSIKLARTASGNLNERVTVSFDPGKWYRLTFYDYGGSAGLTNAAQIRIYNATTAKYLASDGYTWQAGATQCVSNTPANGAWTAREFTFLTDSAGASTDTIYVYFVHNESSPVNGNIYFDSATLRGPYGGDFRETTTALLHGWKEGSFKWSLDKADRETNRVSVRFVNESGQFGPDEAFADDFTHQATHPVKSISIDSDAIADRDQARRLANFHLAKRRTLGPGCEFVGTPAALALQPGDVILVSHTVPNWTCKEQRVTDVEVLGLGDPDEAFVLVRTEDYQESIYSDSGAVQYVFPPQTTPTLTVTVSRNAGGVLDLTFDLSDPTYAVRSYEVHMSDTTGFTPSQATLIGTCVGSRFTYQAQVDELNALRYFVVVALTDRTPIQSAEFSTTIYRNESTTSGYSGNFQYPTTIQSVDPATGSTAYVNESGGAATVAKINDSSDSTYLKGTAHGTAGTPDDNGASIRYHSFGAGTGKTGRPYVRAKVTRTVPTTYQEVKYYYTLDRTAGTPTWVLWATITDSTISDYYGPELTGVDYSKFALRATCKVLVSIGSPLDRTTVDYHYKVAFDEKA